VKHVFVDTGGFVALLIAEDRDHLRAASLFELAARERWTLVTTNAVVIETYAVLLSRARDGRRLALSFLDSIPNESGLTVERIRLDDEQNAAALLRSHQDKGYSFCDAISFVVMHRLSISEAIAFDRHFREYGRFTIL
jgi:predicted nucleic acid-binding protein